MNISGNTILLTGGSSGIGLALAKRFLDAGNVVIVTGRREAQLAEAKKQLPSLVTFVSDSGNATDRVRLVADVTARFPRLNVVINNAGIQRKVNLLEPEAWEQTREEIAINLDAPIHMSALVIPHLAKQEAPVIINVSSGLAFVAMAAVPIYCATKAALHSYTMSLRHQLRKTPITVVEVIPPAVHSNLGGSHAFGVPTDEYADSVMAQLAEGRPEVTYQFSLQVSQGSRADVDAAFARLNS